MSENETAEKVLSQGELVLGFVAPGKYWICAAVHCAGAPAVRKCEKAALIQFGGATKPKQLAARKFRSWSTLEHMSRLLVALGLHSPFFEPVKCKVLTLVSSC